MRRHSPEEKTGLKAGAVKSSLLFFFLLLNQQNFSQVEINGFSNLQSFSIPKGYTKLFVANIDQDLFDDFIFYSPDKRKIGIALGTADGITDVKEYYTHYSITEIVLADKIQADITELLFIDRKNRLLGSIEYTPEKSPKFFKKYNFGFYPENIDKGKIKNESDENFLISGSSFEGLSIIFNEDGKYSEKKIAETSSYSNAVFIDLNKDGKDDIAAYDLLENTLQAFMNDGSGNFELTRSAKSKSKITTLKSSDIDNNSFDDLLFVQNNNIKILFGDFQSSYDSSLTLVTRFFPDNFSADDFNADGRIDFAYLNKSEGVISILFGTGYRNFSDEIIYIVKPGLSDFSKYKSKGSKSIAILNSNGTLHLISALKNLQTEDQINIVPCVNPITLTGFDYKNDNITDFCFINEFDNSLVLLINDERGRPVKYYSLPVSASHQKIIADDSNAEEKTFYCYSRGDQLIELIKFNFIDNSFSAKQFYAPGTLFDLDYKVADSSLTEIFVTYNRQNKLYTGKFEYRDLSVTYREFPFIDRNVLDAQLFLNGEAVFYYWKIRNDSLYFMKSEMRTGPNIYRQYFGLQMQQEAEINSYLTGELKNFEPSIFSIIRVDENNFAVVSDAAGFNIYTLKNEDLNSALKNPNLLFEGIIENKSANAFTYYDERSSSIKQIKVVKDSLYFKTEKLLDAELPADYFVDDLLKNKIYYLVYSNKKEGCLSVVPLKK